MRGFNYLLDGHMSIITCFDCNKVFDSDIVECHDHYGETLCPTCFNQAYNFDIDPEHADIIESELRLRPYACIDEAMLCADNAERKALNKAILNMFHLSSNPIMEREENVLPYKEIGEIVFKILYRNMIKSTQSKYDDQRFQEKIDEDHYFETAKIITLVGRS